MIELTKEEKVIWRDFVGFLKEHTAYQRYMLEMRRMGKGFPNVKIWAKCPDKILFDTELFSTWEDTIFGRPYWRKITIKYCIHIIKDDVGEKKSFTNMTVLRLKQSFSFDYDTKKLLTSEEIAVLVQHGIYN